MGGRRQRRAEQFGVRQWLQLGAASAGVGAALLGFSLVGPDIGTAAADTSGESSAASTGSAGGAESTGPARSTPAADRESGSAATDTDRTDDVGSDDAVDDADDRAGRAGARPLDQSDEDPSDVATTDEVDADADAADGDDAADDDVAGDVAEDDVAEERTSADGDDTGTTPAPATVTATATASPRPTHEERVAEKIAKISASAQAWIDARPVSDERKDELEAAWAALRRSLLNQAPTLTPVQLTGVITGEVTGTVDALDPDGDRLVYRVVRGPATGKVHLNADGTFTYTPGEGFDGVDTFVVRAVDLGLHINLLDWFRPIGTRAGALINQGAVTFDFVYTEGAEHWTPERRAALQRSADALVTFLRVAKPVVLTYEIEGVDNPDVRWLAGAGSGLISTDPGYWPTIVQNKLLTGKDANGAGYDGSIEWNFAKPWALGDVVVGDEYDFMSTAMHELLHSFGFASTLEAPGTNSGRTWSIFDSFISTADGTRLFAADFTWPSSADPYLTGFAGGVFFGGSNAVAAYGKPVPLYSPNPWKDGSSSAHLDDDTFTGDDFQLMNHKAKWHGIVEVREISAIEAGILRDLGYTVVLPRQSALATGVLVGLRA
ncbi:hypothetical protein MCHLDSM_05360 [Mycolicibacterium chlorophenolicum]|uniref:Uncharacterized protein n=1 Tax=Mycolicibacterium chlorophenolicum TaxID=37916 RepID=A0A0J6VLQ5_9MYCO|nr:hypothetical protein MCHLDSM_05360 [Mycolicibacterium chlorophenolicum]